jgi:hypothetical protein
MKKDRADFESIKPVEELTIPTARSYENEMRPIQKIYKFKQV